MTTRLSGVAFTTLLPRLPRNLVVVDGHCGMTQAWLRRVLQRNFSYFTLYEGLTRSSPSTKATARLERHRMFFASYDMPETEWLMRALFGLPQPRAYLRRQMGQEATYNAANDKTREKNSCATVDAAAVRLPARLVVLLIEKVPSHTATLLSHQGGRVHGRPAAHDVLFTTSDRSSGKEGRWVSELQRTAAQLGDSANVDLLVSTNYTAMCRIGMHLDRTLLRVCFSVLYRCVPTCVGEWWFARVTSPRRAGRWGRTVQDTIAVDGLMTGMKERRCRFASPRRAPTAV